MIANGVREVITVAKQQMSDVDIVKIQSETIASKIKEEVAKLKSELTRVNETVESVDKLPQQISRQYRKAGKNSKKEIKFEEKSVVPSQLQIDMQKWGMSQKKKLES